MSNDGLRRAQSEHDDSSKSSSERFLALFNEVERTLKGKLRVPE
jgi:hypothetical protein